MQLSNKWQLYFANIAIAVSGGSKDPSTKVGAVIYRPDRSLCSAGYNGLPRGIPETPGVLLKIKHDREWKLARTVHAEANALDHKRECVHGYGMVITAPACSACALKIISNGIKTVYHLPASVAFKEKWSKDCGLAYKLFAEANVEVRELCIS